MKISNIVVLMFFVVVGYSQDLERYGDLHDKGLITDAEYTVLVKAHNPNEVFVSSSSLVNKYYLENGIVTTNGISPAITKHLKSFGSWLIKNLLGIGNDCCDSNNCQEIKDQGQLYYEDFNR